MTLTAKRETEIIDEEIDAMYADEKQIADSIIDDGGMPGDIALPGPERLDAYWRVTPDLSDVPLLLDPDWELRIRNGFDRPPVNPYWKNLLRQPGLLKETAADFVRLNAQYADRYQNEVAQGPGQPAFPANGGVPLPQTPAPGPAQPQVGGGYLGAGMA